MSGGEFDDEDEFVSPDFQSIIYQAQINELEAESKRHDEERERAQELRRKSEPKSMTLMQIAGLRSQKEVDGEQKTKTEIEEKKSEDAELQRKQNEEAMRTNKFPAPTITRK